MCKPVTRVAAKKMATMNKVTKKSTKSVSFSTGGPAVIGDSMSYKLSDSLKERLWMSQEQLAAMRSEGDCHSTTQVRGLSPKQYKHRRDTVAAILAQQEEQREELGGSTDEKGLRMLACALSKQDQKKALQLARMDALEAYDIHKASSAYDCHSSCSLKSIEEYSKKTTVVPTRRSIAIARGA
ncbi:expressed unknown protein [Seminavis robusta]|uniref:Uncharacterized protein n=1 Tax=Seminavis robusta TaxID=568900 RepID=A0A9N8D7L4_9STRA|nr:expressed unknown protein [Seminavis robusta]|eukprot:Sro7_g006400.1 n/a (183) ;mRNA; r:258075-258623